MNPVVVTFKELRRAVGWLGILLPFVLSIGLYALNGCGIQDSISQYYYTRMGSYLTGTLCAVGLFLFAYKGYPGENDGKWCNFAAVCALGVAFIPMQLNAEDVCCPQCIVHFTLGDAWWRCLHFVSAALFFGTLAFMAYARFTKSDKEIVKGSRKHSRNRLYKLCGLTIFLCILALAIYNFGVRKLLPDVKITNLTFFLETVMLIAFGTAWLVKGEGVKYLNDKPANE
jgi:hypothetical protein